MIQRGFGVQVLTATTAAVSDAINAGRRMDEGDKSMMKEHATTMYTEAKGLLAGNQGANQLMERGKSLLLRNTEGEAAPSGPTHTNPQPNQSNPTNVIGRYAHESYVSK